MAAASAPISPRAASTVVSGLARGVDSAAHRGALAAAAHVAVLGSGVDRVYPAEHAALAADIAHAGVVLSEYPPGTPPLPFHFPLRNRMISGLSRAVVVIEAPEKSGFADHRGCALEQGRDVMAVPGQRPDGRNRGGHALIRDGAKIVETARRYRGGAGLARCGWPATRPQAASAEFPEASDFTDPMTWRAWTAARRLRSSTRLLARAVGPNPANCCEVCSTR